MEWMRYRGDLLGIATAFGRGKWGLDRLSVRITAVLAHGHVLAPETKAALKN